MSDDEDLVFGETYINPEEDDILVNYRKSDKAERERTKSLSYKKCLELLKKRKADTAQNRENCEEYMTNEERKYYGIKRKARPIRRMGGRKTRKGRKSRKGRKTRKGRKRH